MPISEVVVKDVPEMQVVGVRKVIAVRDIGTLFGEAGRQLRSKPAGPPMAIYHDKEWNPEKADIEVVFPVTVRGHQTLPATKVASVTHLGAYEDFGPTYAAIFGWMSREGYVVAYPPREIYLVGPESGRKPEEYATEIQVPIKPA